MADTESESSYNELFRSLKTRGLKGVELVVSDDHQGLRAAVSRHFQGASWHRCQVHYTRTLMGMVAGDLKKALADDLKEVFGAATLQKAHERTDEVAEKWRGSHPKVAEHIEEHIEECFAVYAFPQQHRARIRSTNGLERFNEEIKRRSRVVRIFPNTQACLRLVTALCAEQSDEWRGSRVYLNMQLLTEHLRREGGRELDVA